MRRPFLVVRGLGCIRRYEKEAPSKHVELTGEET